MTQQMSVDRRDPAGVDPRHFLLARICIERALAQRYAALGESRLTTGHKRRLQAVRRMSDGQVFGTVTDAMAAAHVNHSTMYRWLNERHGWERIEKEISARGT